MALQSLPFAIQGGSHPAEIARNAFAAAFGVPHATHTAGVSVTTAGGGHGVVGAGDMAVTQLGTPAMKVNVAAGAAIVRAGGARVKGVYPTYNDATVEVTIAASDATNPRIDLIILHTPDTNYGDASNVPVFVAVAGTPAASPAVPSLSSYPNCLVLAQIAVAAGATSIVTANITDKRTYAAALGGTLYAPLTALLPASGIRPGTIAYDDQTDSLKYTPDGGTTWSAVGATSTVGVVGKASNSSSTQAVTTEADLTNLTATITAVAGRCYKVTYKIAGTMSAVDMQWWARVYADGAAVDGTYGNRKTFYGTAGKWDSLSGVVYITGLSAGSRVIKLRAATTGGTATIDYANATAYMIVEDIGAG